MFGQTSGRSSNASSSNRFFVYEVTGLHQNDETDGTNPTIRSSASVFMTVPFNRMNEEMQRIARLGGKILSIQLLGSGGEVQTEG